MPQDVSRFTGTGTDTNPNDCSLVTADGKVVHGATGNISGSSSHGVSTENVKREEARERIVEENKAESRNNLPVKLKEWDEISTHLKPNTVPDAHFIVVPDQEEDTAWFFPSCNTYFLSPSNWKELCEQGMDWWAARSEEMAYINDDLPSPYTDPTLEPLLSMVRPKVMENNT